MIDTMRPSAVLRGQPTYPSLTYHHATQVLIFDLGVRTARIARGICLILLLSQSVQAQMIVAHRGASADAPENTLAAFREAWLQKADGIEGDFYFTRDQRIVCIHDSDTERTGGSKRDVRSSTLEQLRQLEYGSWKDEKFRGEPLPTLEDVLATVPENKTIVIELKTGPKIVPLLKAILERSKLSFHQYLVISFDAETVAESKRLLPEVRAHWLAGYKQNATGGWKPSAEEILKTLRKCNADGFGTQGNRDVVTRDFLERLKSGGMQEFHVWTVDDLDDARFFQEMGAVGITTNRPGRLRNGLKSSLKAGNGKSPPRNNE